MAIIMRKGQARITRTVYKKVLWGMVMGFCLIAMAEVAIRVMAAAGHPVIEDRWFEYDPELLWKLKPDFKGTYSGVPCRIHPYGFRGDPSRTIVPKKTNELRILCLGDSRTFGYGVKEEDSYPVQLENELKKLAPDMSITVFNGGTPGYSSYQGAVWLERYGLSLEPDVIAVAFSFNDRRAVEDKECQDDRSNFRRRFSRYTYDRRLGAFSFYRLLKKGVFRLCYPEASPLTLSDWKLRVSPDRYRSHLVRICEIARAHSIMVFLLPMNDHSPAMPVLRMALTRLEAHNYPEAMRLLDEIPKATDIFSPMISYYWEEVAKHCGLSIPQRFNRYLIFDPMEGGPPLRADVTYNQIMREVGQELGVEIVDIGVLLEEDPDYYLDFCHFSAAGNHKIGLSLASEILEGVMRVQRSGTESGW